MKLDYPKEWFERSAEIEGESEVGAGCQQEPCSAGPLTAEMIREMLGHVPFDVGEMPDRWQWMANYLNETLRDPGAMCPCCNITRRGELMDHLPSPPLPSLPNASRVGPPTETSTNKNDV